MEYDFTSPAHSDRLRQGLNLVLSVAMPAVTALAFGTGTTFQEATRSEVAEPQIVPAGYAFAIWTLIYGGCVGYIALACRPARRAFRRG